MNWKQISRTKSTTHSVRIRRKWSTTLTMWSTSNCARPLQKCNARAVCLIGQKALSTSIVEIACATRKPCAGWIENVSVPYRFRITRFWKRNDMDDWGADPLSPSPSTHGNDAERRKMPQVKNYTRIQERFLKDPQYRQSQGEIGWYEA